ARKSCAVLQARRLTSLNYRDTLSASSAAFLCALCALRFPFARLGRIFLSDKRRRPHDPALGFKIALRTLRSVLCELCGSRSRLYGVSPALCRLRLAFSQPPPTSPVL